VVVRVSVSPIVNELLDEAAHLSMRRGQRFVGVEHLFEVLAGRKDVFGDGMLDGHAHALDTAAQHLARNPWQGRTPPEFGELSYTPRLGAITAEAGRLAQRLSHAEPGPGHLLLAIIADAQSSPSRTLDDIGADRGGLIEALRNGLCERTPTAPKRRPAGGEPIAQTGGAALAVETGESPQTTPATSPATPGAAPFDTLVTDLTERARAGKLSPAIGRDTEIMRLLEVLSRQSKNNAILVGEAGVGKTKVAEGLAMAIAKGAMGADFEIQRVVELNIAALLAGTAYRGAFEERLLGLVEELKQSPNTLLFVDEIHLMMGAGGTEGSGADMANLLKPALARGDIRCVGATTLDEYRKFIARDPALERRFQMLRIEPLTEGATLAVLQALRPSLEKHHGVQVSTRAMKASISLTQRYMASRQLPDKAIDILDHACARHRLKLMAARQGISLADTVVPAQIDARIMPHDIRKVVSQLTSIPLEAITAQEREQLLHLDRSLRRVIIGQDEAVTRVAEAARTSRAGLSDPNRPDAAMLFCGPTGVGKTELAKALAQAVYGSARHLLTFDMSGYGEAHSVSRLLGAPPGYAGSDEEGLLTKALQDMPYSVVLFDEIEKAHPQIFDIFLPILDEGRLRDSRGREVSFRNCMVIFTSNIGADMLSESGASPAPVALTQALLQHFRPEFINRIDEIVPFYPLLSEDIRAILKLMLHDLRRRLREKGMDLHVYQGAITYLGEQGNCAQFGARELRRTLDRLVVQPVSSMLLEGRFKKGNVVEVLIDDGRLVVRGRTQDESRAKAGV